MSVPFQRRSPGRGDPPLAEEWNGFIEAYQAYVRNGRRFDFNSAESTQSQTLAKIQNLTGDDLPRFAVVELGEPLIDLTLNFSEFASKPSFEGVLPSSATGNRLGIVLDPIGSDQIARAVVAGIVPCLVEVSDTSHGFAQALDGSSAKLESADDGPVAILWKQEGTGTKWAMVRIGGGGGSSGTSTPGTTTAHVEFLSRTVDTTYPDLYQGRYFVEKLNSTTKAVYVLPIACWIRSWDKKRKPTLGRMYLAKFLDDGSKLEEKSVLSTSLDCCDDINDEQGSSSSRKMIQHPCWPDDVAGLMPEVLTTTWELKGTFSSEVDPSLSICYVAEPPTFDLIAHPQYLETFPEAGTFTGYYGEGMVAVDEYHYGVFYQHFEYKVTMALNCCDAAGSFGVFGLYSPYGGEGELYAERCYQIGDGLVDVNPDLPTLSNPALIWVSKFIIS